MKVIEIMNKPIEKEKKITIEIYNKALDTIVESINRLFLNNNDTSILIDLSLLSASNFNLFQNGLTTDFLTKLFQKIKPFLDDDLSKN